MCDEFKTVYLVTHGKYSDYSVDAVFSTREAAEELVRRLNGSSYSWDEASTEEFAIDAPVGKDWSKYDVTIYRDGTVSSVTKREGVPQLTTHYLRRWIEDEELIVHVWTNSEARAVKIANERRAQVIASGEWD